MASIHETKCASNAPKSEFLNTKKALESMFTIKLAVNTTRPKRGRSPYSLPEIITTKANL